MKRFLDDYAAQLWWSFCLQGIGFLSVVNAGGYNDVPASVGILWFLDLICSLCLLFNISAMRRGDTVHFWLALILSIIPCSYVYLMIRAFGPILVQELMNS